VKKELLRQYKNAVMTLDNIENRHSGLPGLSYHDGVERGHYKGKVAALEAILDFIDTGITPDKENERQAHTNT
jgi:hypothetical protein